MIKDNIKEINEKIRNAEIKAGRPEHSVKLMCVSKFHPVDSVIQALSAGETLFGENRVQEACDKFSGLIQLHPDIDLHLIGHLQRNKVKNIIKCASSIDSIDSIELLEQIERYCTDFNKTIKVLFELHTGEKSKSGFESADKIDYALQLFSEGVFSHIIPYGFMTMAPLTDDTELIRKSFRELKNTQQFLQKKYSQYDLSELSMGMSNDYEIAIEEGSTMIRIGTAIFGKRQY